MEKYETIVYKNIPKSSGMELDVFSNCIHSINFKRRGYINDSLLQTRNFRCHVHPLNPNHGQLTYSFPNTMWEIPKLENVESFNIINIQKTWLI